MNQELIDKTVDPIYIIYKLNCVCGRFYYGITNKLSSRKFAHKKSTFNKTKRRYHSPVYKHIRQCVKTKDEFQEKIVFEVVQSGLYKQEAVYNEYHLIKDTFDENSLNCLPNIDKLIKNNFNVFF